MSQYLSATIDVSSGSGSLTAATAKVTDLKDYCVLLQANGSLSTTWTVSLTGPAATPGTYKEDIADEGLCLVDVPCDGITVDLASGTPAGAKVECRLFRAPWAL